MHPLFVGAYGDQKWAMDSLEPEKQVVVSLPT